MKYLIASDLHGSARYCRALLEMLRRDQADRLVLLGTFSTTAHGTRCRRSMTPSPLPRCWAVLQSACCVFEATATARWTR